MGDEEAVEPIAGWWKRSQKRVFSNVLPSPLPGFFQALPCATLGQVVELLLPVKELRRIHVLLYYVVLTGLTPPSLLPEILIDVAVSLVSGGCSWRNRVWQQHNRRRLLCYTYLYLPLG